MSQIVNPPVIQEFNDITLNIIPDEQHEFLLTTKEVAEGYGVGETSIRKTLERHNDELLEGKHYLRSFSSATKSHARESRPQNRHLKTKQTLWTKRGIVRLGFFIKSERAKHHLKDAA